MLPEIGRAAAPRLPDPNHNYPTHAGWRCEDNERNLPTKPGHHPEMVPASNEELNVKDLYPDVTMVHLDPLEFFRLGMKREISEAYAPKPEPGAVVLDLGPGANPNPLATAWLDRPDWNAETDPIPYANESVDAIWATHFFEHIRNFGALVAECERVLKPGGQIFSVVPYYRSQMAFQDHEHVRFFTESTWGMLVDNPFYERDLPRQLKLAVTQQFIMGIVERNLALFTILRKTQ